MHYDKQHSAVRCPIKIPREELAASGKAPYKTNKQQHLDSYSKDKPKALC